MALKSSNWVNDVLKGSQKITQNRVLDNNAFQT